MSSVLKLRAVLLQVGEPARVVELEAGYKGLQAALGGIVECFARFDLLGGPRVADCWCLDDFTGEQPNRLVRVPEMEFPISGPVLVTVGDESDGGTYSLTDQELEIVMCAAARWPVAISMPEADE